MLRAVLVGLFLVAAATDARANGRPPSVVDIHFRQGHDADIVSGTTFGFILSHDGGATWHWMCEKAGHYGGMFDPDYSYSPTGSIFATSFDGLLVARPTDNLCTFNATPPGTTFVSQDELGPDHALYYTAADPADDKVYKSVDEGVSFPTSATPTGAMLNDWPQSLVVAPSNPSRLYLSGYRYPMKCSAGSSNAGATCKVNTDCPGGTCDTLPKLFLMYTSTNGGASFAAAGTTGFTTAANSTIELMGVDPTNEQVVYARVTLEDNNQSSGLYVSTNAGTSWTHLISKSEQIYAVVRFDGSVVAATEAQGGVVFTNKGANMTNLVNPPHVKCLAESSAHEVWACTQNYGIPGVPSDNAGIMKTTNLTTWTPVLKYQDIQGPVDCPAGTVQHDTCQGAGPTSPWCMLKSQLGITADPTNCAAPGPDGATDAGSGSGSATKPKGCCDTGGGGGPAALLGGLVAGALLLRPRRPKER